MREELLRKHPTIGCCGIDCGLCPRYYTQGSSKCPGCLGPQFIEVMGQTCSMIKCCVQQHNKEICGECNEFPCQKFNTKWFGEDAYDSFVTHKMALANMQFIHKHGIKLFLKQQKKRILILEELLQSYNDGRSKNFYCLATALLPLSGLEKGIKTLKETKRNQGIKKDDLKNRAKITKDIFNKIAEQEKIQLKLNKPPTWKK